jgi:hypothetical protein
VSGVGKKRAPARHDPNQLAFRFSLAPQEGKEPTKAAGAVGVRYRERLNKPKRERLLKEAPK